MATRAKQTTAVATKPAAGLPTALAERMARDAGKGVSTRQEDNLVPIIYLLQKGSPQVNKRDDAYVDGAEAGDIFLRNAPSPLIDGEEGMIFQPAFFDHCWNEWRPRKGGGGFVACHYQLPADVEEGRHPENKDKVILVRPNGNEVIETRRYMGLVHMGDARLPYVLSLSGTGHTFAKQLMSLITAKRLPTGGIAPSFGYLYKITTKHRSNNWGDFFNFAAVDAGAVQSLEDYEAGNSLNNAFSSGGKVVESPEDTGQL